MGTYHLKGQLPKYFFLKMCSCSGTSTIRKVPAAFIVKNCHARTFLTLTVPSLLVPALDTKGRGGGRGVSQTLPAISKTLGPMNLKFCRISETSLNVLQI